MTDIELVEKLARVIDVEWKFAARDKCGTWFVYLEKPVMLTSCWESPSEDDGYVDSYSNEELLLSENVFKFEVDGRSWKQTMIDLDEIRFMPIKKPEVKKKQEESRYQALEI